MQERSPLAELNLLEKQLGKPNNKMQSVCTWSTINLKKDDRAEW